MTSEQAEERAKVQNLLRKATLPALESIIEIACNERHRDRFKACQFILDKAYGSNTSFLANDGDSEPITINIVRGNPVKRAENDDEDWD